MASWVNHHHRLSLLPGGLKVSLGICLKNDEFRVVTASPDLAVIIEPFRSVTV